MMAIVLSLISALLLGGCFTLHANPADADPRAFQVYKSPTCGCCQSWIDYIRSRGYAVTVSNVLDMSSVKRELGVPDDLAACHTAVVGGYFIEGHVPAEDIARLLAERPNIAGLAVPGMPVGSPGMEGPNPQPYWVLAVKKDGSSEAFAAHAPEPDARVIQVYAPSTCVCCRRWVDYLERRGYKVTVSDVQDLSAVRRKLGVPEEVASCHTAVVGGYFIEGHVPEQDISRLLAERPDIAGLALPGMPIGSPGMEGHEPHPYSVLAVQKDGTVKVFADHPP
jgi:hypothetical protein